MYHAAPSPRPYSACAHACAEAHEERVPIDVQNRRRVVDPNRRGVQPDAVADQSRDGQTERRRVPFLKVIASFNRREARNRHRRRGALPDRVVLCVELERLVNGGAIDGGLNVRNDAEPVLESDHGALIETKQVAGVLAETAAAQVAVEPVRQLKVSFVQREPQRRGERDDAEVRLREHERGVVVFGSRRLGGGVRQG